MKLRWSLASILFIVILLAHYYPTTAISQWIIGVVSSTQDFNGVRQLLISESKIAIPVFDDGQPILKNYETLTKQQDGFLLRYNRPITIYAANNGVVIFSAHRATTEKAVIVAYDDGITAHYEHVTTIQQLPYTAIAKGEQLATLENGQLFLSLYKNGTALSENEVIRWLYESF